jgi:hypothetical protein
MTAPYPQYGPVVNGLYLTKQPNAGIPGGPSVSDALYEVQSCTIDGDTSSIVTGEAVIQALAVEAGTIEAGNAGAAAGARVAALVSRNRDYMRDFYDSASVLKDENGDPIS